MRSEKLSAMSRRSFIRNSALTASGAALASALRQGAYAAGSDELKIGLVGCGGRGTGAAMQALTATEYPVKLWAMGDLFAIRSRPATACSAAAPRDATIVPPSRPSPRKWMCPGSAVSPASIPFKGDRLRYRYGNPGYPTPLSPGTFRGGRQGRRARVHGETSSSGPSRHTQNNGGCQGIKTKESFRRGGHSAAAPKPLPGNHQARAGRRHRRHRSRPVLLEHGAVMGRRLQEVLG